MIAKAVPHKLVEGELVVEKRLPSGIQANSSQESDRSGSEETNEWQPMDVLRDAAARARHPQRCSIASAAEH